MYERILIPTDGSKNAERGAREGVDLAASLGATVHAVHVIEEGGNPWLAEAMEDQHDRARDYGYELTSEVEEMAAEAGVECVSDVKTGPSVAAKINDYVEDNDIDLIVLGSGFKGQIGGLLGGTAEKLLRSPTVPILSVRESEVE